MQPQQLSKILNRTAHCRELQPPLPTSDALVEIVSLLEESTVEEGTNRLNDFFLLVCKENLKIMAKNLLASQVQDVPEGVTMSPMINPMMEAYFLSLGGRSCTSWVRCALRQTKERLCFSILDPWSPQPVSLS